MGCCAPHSYHPDSKGNGFSHVAHGTEINGQMRGNQKKRDQVQQNSHGTKLGRLTAFVGYDAQALRRYLS